jgi:hypothetical protein
MPRKLWGRHSIGGLRRSRVFFDEVHDTFMIARALECNLESAIVIKLHFGISGDTIVIAKVYRRFRQRNRALEAKLDMPPLTTQFTWAKLTSDAA